jgi:hypothetical protein
MLTRVLFAKLSSAGASCGVSRLLSMSSAASATRVADAPVRIDGMCMLMMVSVRCPSNACRSRKGLVDGKKCAKDEAELVGVGGLGIFGRVKRGRVASYYPSS